MKEYKNVRLYISDNDCFVEYYYRIPGSQLKYKRFKERLDILKMFNVHGRRIGHEFAKEALQFMKDKLADGFNPFRVVRKDVIASSLVIPVLTDIKKAMNEGASKTMVASYLENYNRLTKWITEREYSGLFMSEFLLHHAEDYKQWMLNNKLSVKTVNSSLSYASAFWKVGIKKGAAISDIFDMVSTVSKDVSVSAKEIFEPFTAKEMAEIFGYLKESGQDNFIRFVLFIYYSWARPVEITRLRVEDINLKEGLIRFKKSQTKNAKSAFVQIVPPLKNALLEMNLENYDANMYLFSKDNNYMPGKVQISKNMPSDRWARWIKEKLKIDKEMYAMKHTGNIDYLLRNKGNINLKWQQMQNRHSSSIMTERYIRKLGAFFIEVGEINFNEYL